MWHSVDKITMSNVTQCWQDCNEQCNIVLTNWRPKSVSDHVKWTTLVASTTHGRVYKTYPRATDWCVPGHGRGQRSWVQILFQILLAWKPVLDFNLALAFRDLFESHITLAASFGIPLRLHDHGLTNSFIDRSIVTAFQALYLKCYLIS